MVFASSNSDLLRFSSAGKLPPIGGSFAGNGMARPHSATMHDNPKVQFDRNLRSARLQLGMVKQPTAITLTTVCSSAFRHPLCIIAQFMT